MTQDARRTPLLLGILFGLAGMGSSSASVVLPDMAEGLGIDVGVAAWSISLYVLMLAVTTAVYGRVADLVGVRLPLLVGLSLMAAGSLVSALAPTFSVELVARMAQGAGAAAVPVLGVTVLNQRFVGEVRGYALSRLAAVAAAVVCAGPFIGGVVDEVLGWRAVMALPVLGLVVVPALWGSLTREGSGERLDVFGAVLVAATAGGLVLLVQSPTTGLTVAVAGVVLLAVGGPAVAAWVRRRPDGFLPMELVRNTTVVRSALAAAAIPAAWFSQLVVVPVILQDEGWSTWQVGALLLPSIGVAALIPRVGGALIARLGPARALGLAGVLASVSLTLAALGAAFTAPVLFGLGLLFVTAAFGLGQPTLSAAVDDAVDQRVRGVALGIATLLFLVGGSVGSAAVVGLGLLLGTTGALAVLVALPLLGLLALRPLVVDPPDRADASVPDAA
ncbi:MFS transporter [Phycicoccus sp. BSK3Z-2]|uniref:Tetracycline resistance protein n=1 Tax=Phycicoccus avicenniae TaxID=2828860 RepID=A0A941DB91_9MICO|nr:MFS transporter [Phycicoccus avicenniae]MBR7744941.1 MFS transporter [Phycicoccus avicenniae]